MFTNYMIVANSGLTWTPETFYIAATVIHLVLILVAFRVMALPSEYNTFGSILFVVVPTNAAAYFLKDFGIVGVLLTSVVLFGLLTAITRGDVLKSTGVWFLTMASYWAMAYFIVPAADDLRIEDLAGVPQVIMQGGFEAEPFTEDDIESLSGRDDDERRR